MGNIDDTFAQAEQDFKAKRFRQGARKYAAIIDAQPTNAEAYGGLARCLNGLRQYDQAIEAGRKSLALRAGNADAHITLGFAYWRQGKLSESETELRTALALAPGSASASVVLAAVYVAARRFDEAETVLQVTVRDNPRTGFVYEALRVVHIRQGKLDEAIVAAHQSYRLSPSAMRLWMLLDTYVIKHHIAISFVMLITFGLALIASSPWLWIALSIFVIGLLWVIAREFIGGDPKAGWIKLTILVLFIVVWGLIRSALILI